MKRSGSTGCSDARGVLRLCQVLIRLRPRASALWLRVQRPVRWALIVLVIAMLAQALAATSWREVAQNLPVSPWFYLIFLINYFAMPLSEALIYRFLWNTGMGIVPALLRKRVYNEAVLDYSGEPVLFAWARQFTSKTDGELLSDVRDVNVLSALTGNLVTCFILVAVILTQADKLDVGDTAMLRRGALLTGGGVLVMLALAAMFRKWLLALTLRQCAVVGGLHTLRLISFVVLQAWQWHVAVPGIGWATWSIFTALQMAVSRLPLLPAKDLFFAGLAMHLGARLGLAPAVIDGLFVVSGGLNLVAHAAMYALGLGLAPKEPGPPAG